jgi:hypothetical protein
MRMKWNREQLTSHARCTSEIDDTWKQVKLKEMRYICSYASFIDAVNGHCLNVHGAR